MFDHSVTDPLASSYREGASTRTLDAARRRDREKVRKYSADARRRGHIFHPLSIEVPGGWGPEFSRLYSEWIEAEREAELARTGGDCWQTVAADIYWQQYIWTVLQRSIASRLLSRMTLHHYVRTRYDFHDYDCYSDSDAA